MISAMIRRAMEMGLTMEQAMELAEIAEDFQSREKRSARNSRYYDAHKDQLKDKRLKTSEFKTSEKRLKASELRRSSRADSETSNPKRILDTPSTKVDTSSGTVLAFDPKIAEIKTGRGSRLPEDWMPEEKCIEWAVKGSGRPREWVLSETEKFRDYWLSKAGKDARKVDWKRTWHNWLRSAVERDRGGKFIPPERVFVEASQETVWVDKDDEVVAPIMRVFWWNREGKPEERDGKLRFPKEWVDDRRQWLVDYKGAVAQLEMKRVAQ